LPIEPTSNKTTDGSIMATHNENITRVHRAALQAHAAQLCVIPPAEDGTKRPFPSADGKWEHYKTRRPTDDEMRQWYPGAAGLGVISGTVSGGVEVWDFDDRPTYEAFIAAARECGLGDIIDRIESGYCDDTPGGGVRWLVRWAQGIERTGNIKLARRPKLPTEQRDPHDKIKTLIELPLYAIIAPSNGGVHPSGKPYVHRDGTFSLIASYTAEERDALIEYARSFDAMPRTEWKPSKADGQAQGSRPGDDFNARADWRDVFVGWRYLFSSNGKDHWSRPGKIPPGTSAVTFHDSGLLWVFSTSTAFDADKAYNKFGAYTVLNHGGDFQAAAQALAAQGYGLSAHPRGGSKRGSPPIDDDLTSATTDRSNTIPPGRSLIARCASEIAPERIDWLWPDRIAIGKLTCFGGDPGTGKSQIALHAAAVVTKGDSWPCGEGRAPLGSVLILSAEDGAADTVVPRLIAAGADRACVHIVTAVQAEDGKGHNTFNLQGDLDLLEKKIKEVGDVLLVIIDPISSYMGRSDSHKNAEVRQVLEPIGEMAARLRVAILAITHFSKGGSGTSAKSLHRFIGSIAFVGAARTVFAAIEDPDDPSRRLLLHVKNNLARPPQGLAYRSEQRIAVASDQNEEAIFASAIVWDNTPVSKTADEALKDQDDKSSTMKDECKDFLRHILSDGPVAVDEVEKLAREAGLLDAKTPASHCKPLRSARLALGVTVKRLGFGQGAKWVWTLPPTPLMLPATPESAPHITRATTGERATMGGTKLPSNIEVALTEGRASREGRATKEETECSSSEEGASKQLPPNEALTGAPIGAPPPATRPPVAQGPRRPATASPGVGGVWSTALAQLEKARTLPPSNVPSRRWGCFIRDADRFVATWLNQAKVLGWHPREVFGFSGDGSVDHVDTQALLWRGGDWMFWKGGIEVTTMTADTGSIRTPGGNLEHYRRGPNGLTLISPRRFA
jgi:hypothetical protein